MKNAALGACEKAMGPGPAKIPTPVKNAVKNTPHAYIEKIIQITKKQKRLIQPEP